MVQTTPVYGLPYPENGDSPTVPVHMQGLAEAVEDALNEPTHVVLVDQMVANAAAITSTTLVTMMTVTLPAAGQYYFDCLLIMTSTGAAGRPGFALGGTSTPSAWSYATHTTHFNSANASQAGVPQSGSSYPGGTAGVEVTGTDWTTTSGFSATTVKGLVTVSVAGTLTFRVNRASGTSTVNVKSGGLTVVHQVG